MPPPPPNPPEPMPRPLVALAAYLILITALVRLGTSLYLPALPSMGVELNLSAPQISFTLTAYLAAFAAASILLGPLCDHFGRRALVQGGLASYLVGSFLCAIAPGPGALLAGRVLQAVGGGAVQIAARAMTRDAFTDRQMIGVLGWIGVITGMVPVLAPLLGGLLTQGFGWRANFHLLAALTLAVGVIWRKRGAETLPPAQRAPFRASDTLRTYAAMLAAPRFLLPLAPVMLCFAIQGAYLVASPFLYIHLLGMSPAAFGATSLALVCALLAGRSLCMAILQRRGPRPAFRTGAALVFLGGVLLLALAAARAISILPLLTAATVFCVGFGTLLPIGMKAGLSAFPRHVGSSSALYGCLTLGATAAGSATLGALLERTARDVSSLAVFTFAAGAFVLLSSLLAQRALDPAPPRRP